MSESGIDFDQLLQHGAFLRALAASLLTDTTGGFWATIAPGRYVIGARVNGVWVGSGVVQAVPEATLTMPLNAGR